MPVNHKSSYAEIIDALLLWNPPSLSSKPTDELHQHPAGLRKESISRNKHLRSSFQLKEIRRGPEIISGISSVFKKVVLDLKASGVEFPARLIYDHLRVVPTGVTSGTISSSAKEVGTYYQQTTHIYCSTAASVLLYPTMPGWYNLFHIFNLDYSNGNIVSDRFCFPSIDPDKNPAEIYKTIWKALGESTLTTLRDVRDEFLNLATWIFLPLTETSEAYLRDMDKLCGSFAYKVHPVQGAPSLVSTRSTTSKRPDGRSPPWTLPKESTSEPPLSKGSAPPRNKAATSERKQENAHVVDIPNTNDYRSSFGASSEFPNIIQQAWMKSVEHDSSVIVFHCGSLERIAIRHRASQTLYISDLIDVAHCDKPKYGAFHLSLYMAIMQDATDRMMQLRDEKRKRESGPRTRYKTRLEQEKNLAVPTNVVSSVDVALQESISRNILLLSFDLGILVSTTPSAFNRVTHGLLPSKDSTLTSPLRVGHRRRRKLKPTQYLSITLTSLIGKGAVGIVYGGTLTCQTNTTTHANVVVKLVYDAEQKEKLRYEYSVYERLVAAGAKGVPLMFGLFQDFIEDGPLIMVLSDCGRDLWTARTRPNSDIIVIPEREQQLFIDAIRSVHKAGVMHHDIRPENLVITEDGTKATIIDFDQATFDPSAHDKHMERNEVVDLVKGNYGFDAGSYYTTPPGYVPSESSSSASSRSTSRRGSRSRSSSSSTSTSTDTSETSTASDPRSSNDSESE